MLKIHTLGTSHGDSTFSRFNTSTAYETCGVLYLVDAGAPVEALLRRKHLLIKDVRAVFITHLHDDHAGGLTGLVKQATKYPKDRVFPLTLHFPEESAIAAFKGWFSAVHENAEHEILEYRAVDDGHVYEDEYLSVSAIRTRHLRTRGRTEGDPCSFAYVLHFKKENKTILHTGDLWNDFSDFPKIASEQHFDACLCEATHYRPEDAIDLLKASRFDQLIFIHIANRWHTAVEGYWAKDDGEQRLLSYHMDMPYPVMIAHDGETFYIR